MTFETRDEAAKEWYSIGRATLALLKDTDGGVLFNLWQSLESLPVSVDGHGCRWRQVIGSCWLTGFEKDRWAQACNCDIGSEVHKNWQKMLAEVYT